MSEDPIEKELQSHLAIKLDRRRVWTRRSGLLGATTRGAGVRSSLEPSGRICTVIAGRLSVLGVCNSNFLSPLCTRGPSRSSVFTYTLDHVHEHRSNNKHLLAGYHLRPIHLMSGILERYPALCRESIGGSGPFRPRAAFVRGTKGPSRRQTSE